MAMYHMGSVYLITGPDAIVGHCLEPLKLYVKPFLSPSCLSQLFGYRDEKLSNVHKALTLENSNSRSSST